MTSNGSLAVFTCRVRSQLVFTSFWLLNICTVPRFPGPPVRNVWQHLTLRFLHQLVALFLVSDGIIVHKKTMLRTVSVS